MPHHDSIHGLPNHDNVHGLMRSEIFALPGPWVCIVPGNRSRITASGFRRMRLVSDSAVLVSESVVLVSESVGWVSGSAVSVSDSAVLVSESWLVSDSAVLVTDSVVLPPNRRQVMTLEGWPDAARAATDVEPWVWCFGTNGCESEGM